MGRMMQNSALKDELDTDFGQCKDTCGELKKFIDGENDKRKREAEALQQRIQKEKDTLREYIDNDNKALKEKLDKEGEEMREKLDKDANEMKERKDRASEKEKTYADFEQICRNIDDRVTGEKEKLWEKLKEDETKNEEQ